jgi:hypothetical protein
VIRTQNLSRRAAADLTLRARGHWDRHFEYLKGSFPTPYTCTWLNYVISLVTTNCNSIDSLQHRSTNWQTKVLLTERTNWVGSQLVCGQHSAAGNHSHRINSVVRILKGWVKQVSWLAVFGFTSWRISHTNLFFFTCSKRVWINYETREALEQCPTSVLHFLNTVTNPHDYRQ